MKQQINEAVRLKQLAGILSENIDDMPVSEASNQMTPETRAALSSVTMLSAPEVEDFLVGLVKYFNYVSGGDGDDNELPNIDVKALTHHLSQAASVLAARTGN